MLSLQSEIQLFSPLGGVGVVRLADPGRCGSLLRMTTPSNSYGGFRFPAVIIEHAIWLYHCFSLSLHKVELILGARRACSTFHG
jgi:hypothetical protein